MTTASDHLGDRLQEFLDGRLDPGAREQAEAHLAACVSCRDRLKALRWLTQRALAALPQHAVPDPLRARIGSALDQADRDLCAARGRAHLTRRLATVGALAASVALLLVLVGRPVVISPAAIARDLGEIRSGAVSLEFRTSDPAALERWFVTAGIAFSTRVFDFAMMGYQLAGGRVHAVGGRRAALFAYQGTSGAGVICQMYPGRLVELKEGPEFETREHDGIAFRVYGLEGLTLVFWQEGEVVCVLASDIDPEEAVALARAKAVRV